MRQAVKNAELQYNAKKKKKEETICPVQVSVIFKIILETFWVFRNRTTLECLPRTQQQEFHRRLLTLQTAATWRSREVKVMDVS